MKIENQEKEAVVLKYKSEVDRYIDHSRQTASIWPGDEPFSPPDEEDVLYLIVKRLPHGHPDKIELSAYLSASRHPRALPPGREHY